MKNNKPIILLDEYEKETKNKPYWELYFDFPQPQETSPFFISSCYGDCRGDYKDVPDFVRDRFLEKEREPKEPEIEE